tara:strand:+ start:1427 stop:1981 length:555 start_codon:yes stop_codon:yes gene_type:complete
MNSYWFVLDSLLPNEVCEQLISLYGNMETMKGEFGDGEFETGYRNSDVVGLEFGSLENSRMNEILKNYVISANSECFGFNLNGICEFQIAKYDKGGHYKMHQDMRISGRASVRKLSLSVQLSEPSDYRGGELVFSDWIGTPPQEILSERGRIIVFPSFIPHEVRPVIAGSRFSLVGWYEGANFS